jgi:hypothetical protein
LETGAPSGIIVGVGAISMSRRDVLRFRFHRHQLDREADSATAVTDVDLLDYGVQDTGPDGSAWALCIRGAPTAALRRAADPPTDVAIAWTLRGAPHAYRRKDLAAVATATAPFSEPDAAKRVFDAATSFRRGHLDVLDALGTVASTMRTIVTKPTTKGDLSRRLSDQLGAPYVRYCRVCKATHSYEQPFRLAALQAGLVLQPGTSPPVLERLTGFRAPGYRHLGGEAAPTFDVLRNHLRFFGPTTVSDAAAFLDSPKREVSERWPADVEEVAVDKGTRFVLARDVDALKEVPTPTGVVRLLGPFDPFLQLRDRLLLVPEAARRKDLWRVLGRPGAIVVDGEVLGTWRPTTSGDRLTVTVDLWRRPTARERSNVDDEAERLASFRGVDLKAVSTA